MLLMGGEIIPLAAILIVPITAIGYPLARAVARRMEGGGSTTAAPLPSEASARLARMEQAIDAIALEVERISEAQRFTTKLLSDGVARRGDAGAGDAAAQAPREVSRGT